MRKLGWVLMAVLSSFIAVYAAAVLLVPGFGPPFIAERRTVMPWAVIAHIAGGLGALAIGPWQLNARLRTKALARHRWTGRAYVVLVVVGALGALAMVPGSQEGMVTHVGFGLLGIFWLGTTLMAYRRIRAGDRAGHEAWMIRSFALTLAAVTLRIWLPLGLAAGMSFTDAYRAVSWVCWVPNLLAAEWLLRRRAFSAAAPARTFPRHDLDRGGGHAVDAASQ
jgi:hypothetical protein